MSSLAYTVTPTPDNLSLDDAALQVPDDLRELDQWLLWRHLRGTKVPFQVTGKPASSTNPATWATFETVTAAYMRYSDYWSGVGFVFTADDPFAGIDIDDCIDQQGVKEWAYPILERFSDTYAEVSPSGTGIKLWIKATLEHSFAGAIDDGHVEVYDRARYFTVTARTLPGTPLQVEDHQHDVEWLRGLAGRTDRVPHRVAGPIPYGERHYTLVSIGGTLARRGITAGELAALYLAMRPRFEGPPVPDKNLIGLAEDLVRRYSNVL